jgi:hypothetical protein
MPENLDRRGFIRRASMGAVAVGAASVAGTGFLGDMSSANAATPAATRHEDILDGADVLAQVVNARTGEMSILVDEREIKFYDRDLAQKLIRATR